MFKELCHLTHSIILQSLSNYKKFKQAKAEQKIKALERGEKLKWLGDEWPIILILMPTILCFIPDINLYIIWGFDTIKHIPAWYLWATGGGLVFHFIFRLTRRSCP